MQVESDFSDVKLTIDIALSVQNASFNFMNQAFTSIFIFATYKREVLVVKSYQSNLSSS